MMPGPEANRERKARTLAQLLWDAGLRVQDLEGLKLTDKQKELMAQASQQVLGTQKPRVPSKETWQDTLQALRHLEDEERWK